MARLSPDYVILGLLEKQTCHGYQLLAHFQSPERLGHIWKLRTSRIYTLLKQLERQSLIDGREEDAPDAPMRTVYWLTDAGRQKFYDWLQTPTPSASTRNIRTEFLSRLYLAQLLNLPKADIINAQQHACHDKLSQLQKQHVAGMGGLALDLQIQEMHLILHWLETCQTILESVTD